MKKKKLYKGKLNFSKAEMMASQIDLGAVGINMPIESTIDYRKEYGVDGPLQLGSLWTSVNDPKFYEGISAKDVIPKEEDFIEVPFRLLSATTVGAGTWKATDFSDATMLKKSMDKLNNKPVYKDHETDLDNWVGIVRGTKWTESTTQGGIKVPAGIDGLLAIDAKTNPKIARGVLLGSIFSNSVTVEFSWEMSHEFENEWDFYENVGKMGKDGKMIRRVVKEISNYHETSLVWLGADPFAKAVAEDGTLNHIDVGSVYEFTKQSYGKVDKVDLKEETEDVKSYLRDNKKLVINFALDKNTLSLARKNKVEQNTQEEMEKFLAAFIAAFGTHFNLKAGDKPTDEQMVGFLKDLKLSSEDADKLALVDKFSALMKTEDGKEPENVDEFLEKHSFVSSERLASLEAVEKEVEQLRTEKTNLETENASLKKYAETGKKYSKFKKDEAIRLYKATVGIENVEQSVVDLFNKAEDEAIDGLLKQYTKGATEKFSGTCSDCGSHNFKFQSSFTSGDERYGEENEDDVVSTTALREKYATGSINIGRKID